MAENRNQLLTNDPKKPWHIVADEINYDDKAGYYIGKGNVMITKEDKKLTAAFIRFDQKTMKVYAKGHVIMTAGEDTLTGTSMEMNLEAETGTIYNGTIFIKENHFYIKGDKIQKIGKDSYAVDKASITTCDSDKPAWKITGRNLKVTIEGYGFVKHAALWAKKVPVLYTPFLFFPAKLKRQSGLLPPRIGYSDRKWEEYIQPFYWAINESSDATFYLHHMGRRGENLGLEYRYVLDESSKGTLMFDFLDDKKVDDGTPSSKDWAFENVTGSRPNADRYWFRMKHDQSMPFDFSLKLDIDVVSDQDYLHEFKGGYTGFDKTDKYFHKTFGRDLDEYDDPVRINRLNLSRSWTNYNLNAGVRWYDDVIARRQGGTDTTLQKLPFIEFNASKQRLLNNLSYFDLNSEYTYFFREDGTKGHRVDVYPRLYLPLRYKHYFTFEPSFGVRETAWRINEDETTSAENDWKLHRELYDVRLDLSTELFHIYRLNGKGIDKIKHSIRPQIVYDYIPDDPDLSLYPNFEEEIDRIEKKNLVTYSITNTFTSKSKKHTVERDEHQKSEYNEPSYIYREFWRFKLEQSYDINEAKEDNPEGWANNQEKRPFSPIYGELELAPSNYFSMQADAEWCQYEDDFLSHNVAVNMSDTRGDRIFVEHRYTRNSSRSIYTDLLLKISDSLSAYSNYERNLYDRKRIKSSLGFLYKAQCWSIDVSYTHEGDDRRYTFMINLFGLGGLGGDID
ncbi:MAG: LPS-assembly protein LptD [Deltaproteobacteria bacterium]|nr:LPS-assembly protein LptD [Deltaproteobacteria bacterium]